MSVASPNPWPHNNNSSVQPSFQARRPFSSSELLALRKKATEQALNSPPINAVNLQTSSEQTARVRKLASRDMEIARNGIVRREPNPVMKGGGTIPNNTSANVTARMAGNAYSANTFNMQPQLEYRSPGCSTLLNDNITFPKQVVCAAPRSRPAYHIVQGYNQRIRFGGSKNANKVVVAAQTNSLNTATGRCGLTTIY